MVGLLSHLAETSTQTLRYIMWLVHSIAAWWLLNLDFQRKTRRRSENLYLGDTWLTLSRKRRHCHPMHHHCDALCFYMAYPYRSFLLILLQLLTGIYTRYTVYACPYYTTSLDRFKGRYEKDLKRRNDENETFLNVWDRGYIARINCHKSLD